MPRSGAAGKGEDGDARVKPPIADKICAEMRSAVDKPSTAPLSARSYPVPRWRNW